MLAGSLGRKFALRGKAELAAARGSGANTDRHTVGCVSLAIRTRQGAWAHSGA